MTKAVMFLQHDYKSTTASVVSNTCTSFLFTYLVLESNMISKVQKLTLMKALTAPILGLKEVAKRDPFTDKKPLLYN